MTTGTIIMLIFFIAVFVVTGAVAAFTMGGTEVEVKAEEKK